MGKVVINNCYGGFSLSYKAMKWLNEHGLEKAGRCIAEKKAYLEEIAQNPRVMRFHSTSSIENESFHPDIQRHHPLLVQCVEELGEEAGGMCAELVVVEFEGNLYRIDEYDGAESVETPDSMCWEDYTSLEEYE